MIQLAALTAKSPAEAKEAPKTAIPAGTGEAAGQDAFALLLASGLREAKPAGKKAPEGGKDLPGLPGLPLPPETSEVDAALADPTAGEEPAPDNPEASPVEPEIPALPHPNQIVPGHAAALLGLRASQLAPGHVLSHGQHAVSATALQLPLKGPKPEKVEGKPATSQAPQASPAAIASAPVESLEAATKPATSAAPAPAAPVATNAPVAPQEGLSLEVSRIAGGETAASAAPSIPTARHDGDSPVRPQEFTALVDRLVAAREASVQRDASIVVNHADFGPVTMRFEQKDAGLSVALSSADPEFSRAVTAAAAALPTPPERDNSQSNSGRQFGASARQDQSGTNNPDQRGAQGDTHSQARTSDPWTEAGRRASPNANQQPQGRSRTGIFA